MAGFPLPGIGRTAVAVPAPAPGPGSWAGASSATLDEDGSFVIAYRVRVVDQRGAATVIARSPDGEKLTTVAALDKARFGAESLERPALVRTEADGWRLYVCCATPGSKHWWIDVLEADDLATIAPESRIPSSATRTAAGTRGSAATRWTSRTRRTG
jgi:hypothetical protein